MKKLGEEILYIGDHIEEVKDANLITNHILCSVHALMSIDADVKLDTVEAAQKETATLATPGMNTEYNHLSKPVKVMHWLTSSKK